MTSSASVCANSCRKTSPTWGSTGNSMPASEPLRPAFHEPSMSTSSGADVWSPSNSSKFSEISPQYQTLPSTSCAYQSLVVSTTTSSSVAVSMTTMQVMPSISLVSLVTSTSIVSPSPSYTQILPGTSANHGLGAIVLPICSGSTKLPAKSAPNSGSCVASSSDSQRSSLASRTSLHSSRPSSNSASASPIQTGS